MESNVEISIVRKLPFRKIEEILRMYDGEDAARYEIPDIREKFCITDYENRNWKLKVKDIRANSYGNTESIEIVRTGHKI